MIADKILELLDLNKDMEGLNLDKLLDEMGEEFKYGVTRQVFTKKVTRPTLRLSSLGKCIRQQAYTVLDYPVPKLNPRAKMTFLFGDMIEALITCLAKSAGVNLHSEQKEVKFAGVTGHIDGIINDDTLFECKSMSQFGYEKFLRVGISDDSGYISQCQSYMQALGLKQACLVAVNKNTGHIAEQIIYPDQTYLNMLENNVNIIKDLQNNRRSLEDIGRIDPIDETFYRKKTGNKKLSWICSYCNYLEYCWGDNIVIAFKNNKPIYYIKETLDRSKAPKGTKFTDNN